MDNDIKTSLDSIFAKREGKEADTKKKQSEAELKRAAEVEQFYGIRDQIVRPVFEEFTAYLLGRGYTSRIGSRDEFKSSTGKGSTDASISLEIHPKDGGTAQSFEYPHFSVHLDGYKPEVYFHESTMWPGRGGFAGSSGKASLNEITKERIQSEMLKSMAKIFAP